MIVQSAALRIEAIQALLPVTRISLTDLLGNAHADPKQRQALATLLQSSGAVAARVVETLDDGASVLELAAQRVTIRLAATHAPGDRVWITLEPTPGAAAPATGVTLSRSAALLQEIQNSPLNQSLIEIDAAEPLIPSEAEPQALAGALQHAVRSSGLFYESHLADWVNGRVALDDLREEPQARITQITTDSANESRETIHPRLEPLVRQQLDTLERQSITWRGTLWPGQQADMVIAGEPRIADDPTSRAWRIHLDMTLPSLGPLTIDIALNGRRLDVHLQGKDAAAPALRAGRAALALALGTHDLDVNPIRVAAGA